MNLTALTLYGIPCQYDQLNVTVAVLIKEPGCTQRLFVGLSDLWIHHDECSVANCKKEHTERHPLFHHMYPTFQISLNFWITENRRLKVVVYPTYRYIDSSVAMIARHRELPHLASFSSEKTV